MKPNKEKYYTYIAFLIIFMFMCILVSASFGSSSVTIIDTFKILLSKVPILNNFIDLDGIKESYKVIVLKVRFPRILESALVGGALSLVGCTFQAIFRNSLADPHILGISSGAAFGATIAILSGFSLNFLGMGVISIFAFIGAIITVIVVYKVGSIGGNLIVLNLLLTGTAISTMISSAISLLMIYNRQQLENIYLWTLGSFSSANFNKVIFLAIISLIGTLIIFMFSRDLNIIMTGYEAASSLGVDVKQVNNILIIASSLLIAASVSVSGTIGFVGLIIPHCMRLIVGYDHKILLPFSYIGGASFMIICDTIARTVASPTEIPVGIITAFFGAPYFIYLIYKNTKKRSYEV
ncbi:iron ABC transporter permease [Clostridium sp. BJN0001]|uniref:FecCD family ABC transporter permease n=1 Tax=Clostridium sp. BJN0001 TaxID=2930219 RepID=UPI001FD586EE|nr:iron ABC transporter permease [Clostridium sp. BJN0001]